MQGPDVVFPRRDRCITIRQENSSIHIQVTFDPFNDIELWAIYYAPCTESSTTMWYHAQEVRCTDAGLLPLALLHGSLLLTTTKSGHLAVWYLPEFSQDVQLP